MIRAPSEFPNNIGLQFGDGSPRGLDRANERHDHIATSIHDLLWQNRRASRRTHSGYIAKQSRRRSLPNRNFESIAATNFEAIR
jgi:hypothetical protein